MSLAAVHRGTLASSGVTAPKVWTRVAEPLISPGGWGGVVTGVLEPNVIYESGTWKMWYGALRSSGEAVGYATCTAASPLSPGDWTDYGASVLGLGGSSYAPGAASPSVFKFGSTYYLYGYNGGNSSALIVSTSSNGTTWAAPSTIFANNVAGWVVGFGGAYVWKEGATYKMLFDAYTPTAHWVTGYATSSDPVSGWAIVGAEPLTSLAVGSFASYGASFMPNGAAKINGNYHLWELAGANDGLFSDLYHCWSADNLAWHPTTALGLVKDGSLYEKEQIGDPWVIEVAGVTYLFYSGLQNSGSQYGYINVASFQGTLAQFVAGNP